MVEEHLQYANKELEPEREIGTYYYGKIPDPVLNNNITSELTFHLLQANGTKI